MKTHQLKKRLKAAQLEWQKESENADISGSPGYLPGVVKGFAETLRILRELECADLEERIRTYRPLTRQHALQYQKALMSAYKRLKNNDRKGALRTLQQALQQAFVRK